MLETIRELAGERLAAGGEEPAIRAAHARWYLALAEEGGPNRRGAERAAWLDRVGRRAREPARRARLAAATRETSLRLAAAMAPFWVAHGLIDEGKRSLAAVLAARARAEPRTCAGRSRSQGFLRLLDGELEGGEQRVPREPGADAAGRGVVRAVALNVLGTAARYRAPVGEARRRYGEALALATAA